MFKYVSIGVLYICVIILYYFTHVVWCLSPVLLILLYDYHYVCHHLFWTKQRDNHLSSVLTSRLSYSKNGVIRMDGFSSPDQFDDEALALWIPGAMEENHLDQTTAKYILSFIGDKFCQMVMTENTAATWVKKDGRLS